MIRSGQSKSAHYQGAFTIIEVIVTIVILGIALVGVAAMINRGLSNSADVMIESRAIALGYSYLDEILGRRYDERTRRGGIPPCYGLAGGGRCTAEASFGPDGGEVRARFDDVDDYHGLVEGDGELTPLQDAEGNNRSNYDNFRVEVSVRYGGDDPVMGLTETDAKFINVNVRHRVQNIGWDFSVYKGNY